MADVLRRVAGPVLLPANATTVYTVPAATTTAVRAIHVANESAAAATFTLSIGVDAAGKRFFYQQSVDPGTSFDWTGNLVLAAGEVLQASGAAAAALTLTLSGVEAS